MYYLLRFSALVSSVLYIPQHPNTQRPFLLTISEWGARRFVDVPGDGGAILLSGGHPAGHHVGAVGAAHGGVHDGLEVAAAAPQTDRDVPVEGGRKTMRLCRRRDKEEEFGVRRA